MTKNAVTRDMVNNKIKEVKYLYDGTTTICIVELYNGWKEIGTSAVVDPANYNQKLGEELALARAYDQLFKMEGYLLREKLHKEAVDGLN